MGARPRPGAHFRGRLGPDRLASHVSDAAILAGIAPRPAEAVVEHRERVAGLELGKGLGLVARSRAKDFGAGHRALERLGVVGSDDPVGECDVGKVAPVGVAGRVGQVRRAGEREALSADGRRQRRR